MKICGKCWVFSGGSSSGGTGEKTTFCTIYRTCNGNNQVQGNKLKKRTYSLMLPLHLVLFLPVSKVEITLRSPVGVE